MVCIMTITTKSVSTEPFVFLEQCLSKDVFVVLLLAKF